MFRGRGRFAGCEALGGRLRAIWRRRSARSLARRCGHVVAYTTWFAELSAHPAKGVSRREGNLVAAFHDRTKRTCLRSLGSVSLLPLPTEPSRDWLSPN